MRNFDSKRQYLIAARVGKLGGVVGYHVIRYWNGKWTFKQNDKGELMELNSITPDNNEAWMSYKNDNPGEAGLAYYTDESSGKSIKECLYTSKTLYIRVNL